MKKLLSVIVCIALSLTLLQFTQAFAADNSGSLTVKLTDGGNKVFKDFKVSVWRVADGSLNATLDFAGANIDWSKVNFGLNADNSATAKTLYDFMTRSAVLPTAQIVSDADGKAYFGDLENGIYLVNSRDSNNPAQFVFTNFIVPVPYNGSSAATAAPKGEAPGNPNNPNRPTRPDRPVTPNTPNTPTASGTQTVLPNVTPPLANVGDENVTIPEGTPPLANLPQTGLLLWPVPVLLAFGALLIVIGLLINRRRKDA